MGMTFSEYEETTKDSLAQYVRNQSQQDRYTELVLGLFEEASEVTSPIRKTIKGNYHERKLDLQELSGEFGDVFWYITHIVRQLPGGNLQNLATENLKSKIGDKENIEENIRIKQYADSIPNTYKPDTPKTKEERARYFCLGLIKEVGHVAELFGEYRIDGKTLNTEKIKEKLGESLWYLGALCNFHGIDLEQVAKDNAEKVHGRYKADGTVIKEEEK